LAKQTFQLCKVFVTLEVFGVILLELLDCHITQKPDAVFGSCMNHAETEPICALLTEDLPVSHAYHAAAQE